jgi:hypothetical protein
MTTAAALFASLEISRVQELPRRDGGPDAGRRLRLVGIVAAYHSGASVLLGWHRAAGDRTIEVFAAGGVRGTPYRGGLLPMSLPPGALGLPDPGLPDRLRALPAWTRVTVLIDGLIAEDHEPREDDRGPTVEDGLLHVWQAGFAWLVLAEPVPAGEAGDAARAVALQERQARTRAQSPEQAVAADRLARLHRELQRGRSTGLWRVHMLAGGESPDAASAVAGLLCASIDVSGLPYALTPGAAAGNLDVALDRDDAPKAVGSALLAALTVTPADEVPGVRFTVRPEFDVNPETAGRDDDALVAGVVLDRARIVAGPLELPRDGLNRHTFVCGATGAGKSQTVRNLLEEATAGGLPWLVVEPAKAEYRRMADRVGDAVVIAVRPGDPAAPPAGFNPLRPVAGFPVQTHLDLTRSLFLAAFEAHEPFPQVLSAALTRCYEELGWDLTLGEPRSPGHRPRWPTLGDLQRAAEIVVDEIGYGREVTDNVRGFVRVRLAGLRLGTTGRFFEGGHPLDLAALLRANVVFEIEDVGDDRDKAFLMGGLLIQLTEHLRMAARQHPGPPQPGLRHLSVFEEAHRLLRRTEGPGPAAHAVELFAALLAEIRAYGEGLVIAEQIPVKLVPDVIKNTAVKIIHRLPAADDRAAVGATVNLTDEQSRFLVTLPPGEAAVFADGMDRPVLARIRDGTAREHGRTPAASPAAVIGRRSETCGQACLAEPCTLRNMRVAQRLAAEQVWPALWAELAVLGHLTGWPAPALRAHRLRALLDLPDRLRECMLSHAVDGAVASRSTVLSTTAGPGDLARHVLDTLTGFLAGTMSCADREPAFLAAESADPAVRRAVVFGVRSPAVLQRAAGSELPTLLADNFAKCSWPLRYLSR